MRGLLRFYGCQLHHIPPNGVIHIKNFINFCECFLGKAPHFEMFRYFFRVCVQMNGSSVYDLGEAFLQLRPNTNFFATDLSKSVRECHKSMEVYARFIEGQSYCFEPSKKCQGI